MFCLSWSCDFSRKSGCKKKLNANLQFPDVLDFEKETEGRAGKGCEQYELTAVLSHSGMTAFSGHYTAHIRISDSWYSFNDSHVSKMRGTKLNLSKEESLDYEPGIRDTCGSPLLAFLSPSPPLPLSVLPPSTGLPLYLLFLPPLAPLCPPPITPLCASLTLLPIPSLFSLYTFLLTFLSTSSLYPLSFCPCYPLYLFP